MGISGKLAEERRGRLAAERLLELKQEELLAANRKLGRHAQPLIQDFPSLFIKINIHAVRHALVNKIDVKIKRHISEKVNRDRIPEEYTPIGCSKYSPKLQSHRQ